MVEELLPNAAVQMALVPYEAPTDPSEIEQILVLRHRLALYGSPHAVVTQAARECVPPKY